jgi:CMP-N,N'-diacetyllegionaminic acid synthase
VHDAAVIILARGGSKGLRNKNLLPLAGRACVDYTIDAALEAWPTELGREPLVCLSSDSAEIRAVGTERGIMTHERSSDASADRATVDAAAREAVSHLIQRGKLADRDDAIIVILYGNVPIRPRGLVADAARLLHESKCDSVQSYTAVGKHHPYWTVKIDEAGVVRPWQGDVLYHNIFRRQDLPPAQVPDGGVLAVRLGALFYRGMPAGDAATRGPHDFLGRDRRGIMTPIGSVIDIDDEVDYDLAQVIIARRLKHAGSEQGA